jgi:hypothetical protein
LSGCRKGNSIRLRQIPNVRVVTKERDDDLRVCGLFLLRPGTIVQKGWRLGAESLPKVRESKDAALHNFFLLE